jgi:hypothetical protein
MTYSQGVARRRLQTPTRCSSSASERRPLVLAIAGARAVRHARLRACGVVGVHPFTRTPQGVISILQRIRAVMDKAGDRKKPIIADEVSWPSSFGQTPQRSPLRLLRSRELWGRTSSWPSLHSARSAVPRSGWRVARRKATWRRSACSRAVSPFGDLLRRGSAVGCVAGWGCGVGFSRTTAIKGSGPLSETAGPASRGVGKTVPFARLRRPHPPDAFE